MDNLNERAVRLMGWKLDEFGDSWEDADGYYKGWARNTPDGIRAWCAEIDLNDAAELAKAAPEDVWWAVQRDLTLTEALDPAALTRAVVRAWEGHNAKGGE